MPQLTDKSNLRVGLVLWLHPHANRIDKPAFAKSKLHPRACNHPVLIVDILGVRNESKHSGSVLICTMGSTYKLRCGDIPLLNWFESGADPETDMPEGASEPDDFDDTGNQPHTPAFIRPGQIMDRPSFVATNRVYEVTVSMLGPVDAFQDMNNFLLDDQSIEIVQSRIARPLGRFHARHTRFVQASPQQASDEQEVETQKQGNVEIDDSANDSTMPDKISPEIEGLQVIMSAVSFWQRHLKEGPEELFDHLIAAQELAAQYADVYGIVARMTAAETQDQSLL